MATEPGDRRISIARQPIFEGKTVTGYELLYRASDAAAVCGDVRKTSRTVVSAVLEFGFDDLVGEHDAWVNVSGAFLVAGHYLALPPGRVVLEVLEHEMPTPRLRSVIEEAKAAGYRVALDDFTEDSPQWELVPHVDIVKVDFRHKGAIGLIGKLVGDGRTVVAEKVERADDHARASVAGATMFQGFWFARPSELTRSAPDVSNLAGMHLLPALCDPDCDFDIVVDAAAADAALATRLLVAANCSFNALRRRVESVHDAVVLLGADRVRRMAMLSMLDGCRGDAPVELLRLAVLRAELAKALVETRVPARQNAAYTAGLLSVLDALMGVEMSTELLEEIGLVGELVPAIAHHVGELGEAVASAIEVSEAADEALDDEVNGAYLRAVAAADRLLAGILTG